MRNEHKLLPCHSEHGSSLEHAPPSSGLRMKQKNAQSSEECQEHVSKAQ